MPDRHTVKFALRDPFEDGRLERALVDGVGRPQADLAQSAPDGGDAGVLHLYDAAGIVIEGLALLGERHVARVPPQQFDVHLPLQFGNTVGDGGLGDEELFGNARKVFQFYQQQKSAKIVRIHNSISR